MPKPLKALILEDSPSDVLFLLRELRRGGFDVDHTRVDNATDLKEALNQKDWDIILSDYHMPGFDAPDALKIIKEKAPDIPVILVSGAVGEDIAVAAMKAGASDFFSKDKLARLVPAVERELREAVGRHKQHEAEARFATAFHASPVGISISRLSDGVAIDVNTRFLEIFGFSRDEVIGKRSTELQIWSAEQRERLLRILLQSGSVRNVEIEVQKRHGIRGYALVSAEIIQLDNEACILTMVYDITDRKDAEQSLTRHTERLELLHEIDQAILRADQPQAITQSVLARLQSLMGYQNASVITFDPDYRHFTVLATTYTYTLLPAGSHHPIVKMSIIELLQKNEINIVNDLLNIDQPSPLDKALITVGVRSLARIPLISSGKLLGALNIHSRESNAFSLQELDVAKEVAAQLAIAIENARLLEVEQRRNRELIALHQASLQLTSTLEVENVLDGILNYATSLMHANNAHIFLYDGKTLTFGAALWDGKKLEAPYAEPRPEGLTYTVARSGERIVIPNVDHHPFYTNWSWGGAIIGLPLRVADEVHGVMSLAFMEPHHFDEHEIRLLELLADQAAIAIHNAQLYQQIQSHAQFLEQRVRERTIELQASEEELRIALAKEKELNELKTHFVSMVSHDFRTPLTIIQSSTNVLQSFYERLDEGRKAGHFNRIHTQIQRMVELLNGVLTFSRAEAGASALNPVQIDLDQFCRGIADEFQSADDMKHTLIYTSSQGAISVPVDEKLLQQAIINLLTNAFKYSPEGSTVYLDLSFDAGNAVIQVKDSGIGIPKADLPRLFEMFHRAGNVGTIKGTGLGLAIVKRSVEAHGGTIEVESVEGKGTTFKVKLPIAPYHLVPTTKSAKNT